MQPAAGALDRAGAVQEHTQEAGASGTHPRGKSTAMLALTVEHERRLAALDERQRAERADFHSACTRECKMLEVRERAAGGDGDSERPAHTRRCAYCRQASGGKESASSSAELVACVGCRVVFKCAACAWTSECDDTDGFCDKCCLASLGNCLSRAPHNDTVHLQNAHVSARSHLPFFIRQFTDTIVVQTSASGATKRPRRSVASSVPCGFYVTNARLISRT